jgi:hypothetical protein
LMLAPVFASMIVSSMSDGRWPGAAGMWPKTA